MKRNGLKLLENAPILIWHARADGACDWFNSTWLEFTGRPLADELGDGWAEGVHPADLRSSMATFLQAVAECKPFAIEYRLRHRDGGYRWILDQGVPDAEDGGFTGYCMDISEQRNTLAKLEEQQRLLKQAQELAQLGYFIYHLEQDAWESSEIHDELLGIKEDFPRNRNAWFDLLVPEDRARAMAQWQKLLNGHQDFVGEFRIRRPQDSRIHTLKVAVRLKCGEDGKPLAIIGTTSDISDEASNRDRLSLNATVFDHSQQAILITGPDRRILRVNDAFTRIMGYSLDDVRGQNPRILNSGLQDAAFYQAMWHSLDYTDHWRNEIWNRRKDGSVCPGILDINVVHDDHGKVLHYVGVFTEITELKNTQRSLERLVNFDALTGLPNRVLMLDRLRQALSNSNRYSRLMAVCFLDLDNFKPVNDQHGHACGDALLIDVANRLTAEVRGGDTVARLGGDEFVLLLTELEHTYEIEPTLIRILNSVAKPYLIEKGSFLVTASLGVTIFPRDYGDAETLLRHADLAMYRAKQAGRNRYQIYHPELENC